MKKEFQRFMIHSTYELGADHELVENERKIVQDVMNENEIEYTLELSEDMTDGGSHYYILFLIVPKEFAEKVMEILDNAGGLGYEVDFNETLVVGDNTSAIIYEDEKTGYEYNEPTQEEHVEVSKQEPVAENKENSILEDILKRLDRLEGKTDGTNGHVAE